MFKPKDIAEYYNTTQNHYEQWWDLDQSHSLHYGIWESGIKSFRAAVVNTNRILMELAGISDADKVLDAGCGVGGAAIFLSGQKKARVTGITLSERQVAFANNLAQKRGLSDLVDFQVMDYTQTTFPAESYDVVWACESVSSAPDNLLFAKEAFRLLKKGGRLIMSDCFLTKENQPDPKEWIKKWGETWAVSNLGTCDTFVNNLQTAGFTNTKVLDYTNQVEKSAKRMYYASLLGMIPSELYNLTHPKVSRFAKNHYRSGYYQYKALKSQLWEYNVILAEKVG